MQALLKISSQSLTHPTTDNSQGNRTTYTSQSMWTKHSCPCCSYTLLRHMRLGGLYWRCSHCYQEMPVYTPLQEMISALRNQRKNFITAI
jgi:ribosomal protein L37AE/L43A